MFGRHPRLAFDAYLGLTLGWDYSVGSQDYDATKLKKRLQFAYKEAAKKAQKAADWNKANYDPKVREATLDKGNRVFIRQMAFKGSHHISGRCEKDPYVVIDIPNTRIPLYKVRKESDSSDVKVLYRNRLLPFQLFLENDIFCHKCLLKNQGNYQGSIDSRKLFLLLNRNKILIQNRRKCLNQFRGTFHLIEELELLQNACFLQMFLEVIIFLPISRAHWWRGYFKL